MLAAALAFSLHAAESQVQSAPVQTKNCEVRDSNVRQQHWNPLARLSNAAVKVSSVGIPQAVCSSDTVDQQRSKKAGTLARGSKKAISAGLMASAR